MERLISVQIPIAHHFNFDIFIWLDIFENNEHIGFLCIFIIIQNCCKMNLSFLETNKVNGSTWKHVERQTLAFYTIQNKKIGERNSDNALLHNDSLTHSLHFRNAAF